MDIKNTIEMVECFDTLATCLREAKKDGTINWLDIPKFAPMIAAARAAVADGAMVREELSDLDAVETQVLVDRTFGALMNLADALMSA